MVAISAKAVRIAVRVFLVATLVFLVLIASATVLIDFIRHRNAEHFLQAVRTVKVGATAGSEALAIGQTFKAKTYVVQHTELPSGVSNRIVDVPQSDCISGNCSLYFDADSNARWMEALSYPLWRWDALRKWVPINRISGEITVEHGTVTALEVSQGSLQQEEGHLARTVITSKPVAPLWNIRRYTAHVTGGPEGTAPTVELTFNPRSQHPNQEAALDFNLGCLRLGRSCSRCEILPSICEDDEHGNWFYFEMPPELLKDFQAAVNHIKLGSTEDHVAKMVGSGGYTPQQLFDDRLPYRFPDGTIFGNSESSIYYVKKWRENDNDNPKNQKVTFIFDEEDRLVRIDSKADGIHSIP